MLVSIVFASVVFAPIVFASILMLMLVGDGAGTRGTA
jgi:hypothetical protein